MRNKLKIKYLAIVLTFIVLVSSSVLIIIPFLPTPLEPTLLDPTTIPKFVNQLSTKESNTILQDMVLVMKAELARIAGISPLTINRIEKGGDCRMDTKRKIILALGLKLSEKNRVFSEE